MLINCTVLVQVEAQDIKSDGSFDIPKEVTHIGNNAFKDCNNLKSLTLPQGLTHIGDYAFSDCSSLQSFTLPQGLTHIGVGAFKGCSSLQSLALPQGVEMGVGAFWGCGLQNLTLLQGKTSIRVNAFKDGNSFHYIVINSSDPAERERIRKLLPPTWYPKIILKELADTIDSIIAKQLIEVAKIAEINPLYSFFSANGRFLKKNPLQFQERKLTLPEEILRYINSFNLDSNLFYQKAKSLMHKIPIPKNEKGLEEYEARLREITKKACLEARKKHQAISKNVDKTQDKQQVSSKNAGENKKKHQKIESVRGRCSIM